VNVSFIASIAFFLGLAAASLAVRLALVEASPHPGKDARRPRRRRAPMPHD